MSGFDWLLTTAGWIALVLLGVAVVANARGREWARTPTGKSWVRRIGALGALLVVVAAGTFSVWPPGGVYVLAVAGAFAFLAGVLATAGAAGLAVAATGSGSSFAGRVRAFWCAATVQFRATRTAFGVAFLAFGLAAVVAGATVHPLVSAVGALSLGGVFACLLAFAVVGVFVPGSYDEAIAESLRAVR